jgi:glycopeptide antibiotics resistance protein
MKLNKELRYILIVLFIIFMSVVAFLVFSPHFPLHMNVQDGPAPTMIMVGKAPVCYVPFQELTDIGFWLNVLMTMPFGGFLLLLIPRHLSFKWILLIGVLLGCFIEGTQFILDNLENGFLRYVDINDVMSNALGVVLGYYLLMLLLRVLLQVIKNHE